METNPHLVTKTTVKVIALYFMYSEFLRVIRSRELYEVQSVGREESTDDLYPTYGTSYLRIA
jgi:hypothetical protein